jgi:transcriptional regulator GlxA family with amidase domain
LLILAQGNALQRQEHTSAVEEAVSYIEINLAEKLSVRDLAHYVHTSPFHFSRVFKLRTGYAPHEYILKARTDRAKLLLRNTSQSVSAIAELVGFSSESHFVSTFRRLTGMTPGGFRRTPI